MYKVTKEHIRNGKNGDPEDCPIALCLQEHLNPEISVFYNHFFCPDPLNEYAKKKGLKGYIFSDGIRKWISKYDRLELVSEITIMVAGGDAYLKGEKDVFSER